LKATDVSPVAKRNYKAHVAASSSTGVRGNRRLNSVELVTAEQSTASTDSEDSFAEDGGDDGGEGEGASEDDGALNVSLIPSEPIEYCHCSVLCRRHISMLGPK
jgi:hypothetical protein